MIEKILKEYLLWFDRQRARKQVLFFIDSFPTHHTGLNLFHEEYPQDLRNTMVFFCVPMLFPYANY